uniref:Uncharacterized protein n=1 Tax=Arundo donax TaxID=35708 RepID=A0A0A8YHY3_ARUDO
MEVVQAAWQTKDRASNSATRISAKFKLLRRVLKKMEQINFQAD